MAKLNRSKYVAGIDPYDGSGSSSVQIFNLELPTNDSRHHLTEEEILKTISSSVAIPPQAFGTKSNDDE